VSNKQGVSVVVRAGNNKEAAKKFLQQFVKTNTYKPVEFVLLFNKPEQKHLDLATEFVGKATVTVFAAQGRTFERLCNRLRYNHTLVMSTPASLDKDIIANAVKELKSSQANYKAITQKTLNNALLLTSAGLEKIKGMALTAAPKQLQDVLAGKVPTPEALSEQEQLDEKIAEQEKMLIALDDSLTQQYSEIEQLDKKYDGLDEKSDEAKALKAELKERVYKSNDTLKELKEKHDEMERMRIRRYSILA
jgi:uncharacterized coiled-coil protein SlyX